MESGKILFFAKKNRKAKYLLTTHDSSFGGFKILWVMVDTGCSLLLPLKTNLATSNLDFHMSNINGLSQVQEGLVLGCWSVCWRTQKFGRFWGKQS